MDDDLADGCVKGIIELLFQGLLLGTGYGILKVFGRGPEDGGFVEILAYVLGALTWGAVAYGAYWAGTLA